jgi:hypothetical protein
MIIFSKEFFIFILEITFLMLAEYFLFDVKKDDLFIDAALAILIADLVDRRTEKNKSCHSKSE